MKKGYWVGHQRKLKMPMGAIFREIYEYCR